MIKKILTSWFFSFLNCGPRWLSAVGVSSASLENSPAKNKQKQTVRVRNEYWDSTADFQIEGHGQIKEQGQVSMHSSPK